MSATSDDDQVSPRSLSLPSPSAKPTAKTIDFSVASKPPLLLPPLPGRSSASCIEPEVGHAANSFARTKNPDEFELGGLESPPENFHSPDPSHFDGEDELGASLVHDVHPHCSRYPTPEHLTPSPVAEISVLSSSFCPTSDDGVFKLPATPASAAFRTWKSHTSRVRMAKVPKAYRAVLKEGVRNARDRTPPSFAKVGEGGEDAGKDGVRAGLAQEDNGHGAEDDASMVGSVFPLALELSPSSERSLTPPPDPGQPPPGSASSDGYTAIKFLQTKAPPPPPSATQSVFATLEGHSMTTYMRPPQDRFFAYPDYGDPTGSSYIPGSRIGLYLSSIREY